MKYGYKTIMNREGEWIYEDGLDMREEWRKRFGHDANTTELLNYYGGEGWLVTTDSAYAYGEDGEHQIRRIILRREIT